MATGVIRDLDPPELETLPAHSTLEEVIEVMLANNFSQMGLLKDGELIGMVSFQSIARAMLMIDQIHRPERPFAERPVEIAVEQPTMERVTDSVEELFDLLRTSSYVVTVDNEGEYGIVTDYDIREFYSMSLTPFVLIGETETAIRGIIRDVFGEDSTAVIDEMSDDHEEFDHVDTIEKCGFTHYNRLLSVHWNECFAEYFNEHRDFVCNLIDTLAEERNALFHFRIGGPTEINMDVVRLANNYFTAVCSEKRRVIVATTSES